jgi:tetratricopeptide (TPR) repeat protein
MYYTTTVIAAFLTGDTVSVDFDKTWSSSESRSKARSKAYSDGQIINNALEAIAQKVSWAVSPHKETISRELQEGSDDNIKLGIKYLENGRTDQAISIWDQALHNTQDPKCKAAAYYNIAVIKESQGHYKDAFQLYSEANQILPHEELYIQSMTRVEQAQQQSDAMQKWSQ